MLCYYLFSMYFLVIYYILEIVLSFSYELNKYGFCFYRSYNLCMLFKFLNGFLVVWNKYILLLVFILFLDFVLYCVCIKLNYVI